MIVSGLDIDKPRIWVHIVNDQGDTIFTTNIPRNPRGLVSLKSIMTKFKVDRVVMESTSSYWKSLYTMLQAVVPELCVVNAYQLKVLGKHKTDKRDAHLLATWGLLNVLQASYVPDLVIQDLRQLVRTRVSALKHRTTAISQLKTMLEGECPGITSVLKNLNASYSQAFLNCWGKAEWLEFSFAEFLASIKHKASRDALERREEVLGYWWEHPLSSVSQHLLEYHLRELDFYSHEVRAIEELIRAKTLEDEEMLEATNLMQTIPGLGFMTAITISCELGSVERFDNAREAAASTGLTPKLKGSSGRTRAGKITKHGPKSVRRALFIACKTVIRSNQKMREFFERIKKNKNGMIAMVALSRKLVELCYILWESKQPYRELPASS
jgi:transposase